MPSSSHESSAVPLLSLKPSPYKARAAMMPPADEMKFQLEPADATQRARGTSIIGDMLAASGAPPGTALRRADSLEFTQKKPSVPVYLAATRGLYRSRPFWMRLVAIDARKVELRSLYSQSYARAHAARRNRCVAGAVNQLKRAAGAPASARSEQDTAPVMAVPCPSV